MRKKREKNVLFIAAEKTFISTLYVRLTLGTSGLRPEVSLQVVSQLSINILWKTLKKNKFFDIYLFGHILFYITFQVSPIQLYIFVFKLFTTRT